MRGTAYLTRSKLSLTFGPAGGITVGSMGDGESQSDATPWAAVAVALVALGLAGGVAGFALRRRATMR